MSRHRMTEPPQVRQVFVEDVIADHPHVSGDAIDKLREKAQQSVDFWQGMFARARVRYLAGDFS